MFNPIRSGGLYII